MFCNFEVSNKLVTLGYNESCDHVYHIDTNGNPELMTVESIPGWSDIQEAQNEQLPESYISAPSQYRAIRWLTWEYDIFVTPKPEGNRYYAYIYVKKNDFWDVDTNVWPTELQSGYEDSYKAVDAGLTYITKELI